MKNTLAENMLRFGSKNLTRENRKNLKQLSESFASKDGITYKSNFKDQAMFDNYVAGATPDPKTDMLQTAAGASFGKLGVTTNVLTSCIWHAAAYAGTVPAYSNIGAAKSQIQLFQTGTSQLPNVQRVHNQLKLSGVISTLEDTKWWETQIADPTNPKVNITRWNLWIRTNITPNWSAKKALVLPPTTGPK